MTNTSKRLRLAAYLRKVFTEKLRDKTQILLAHLQHNRQHTVYIMTWLEKRYQMLE